MRKVPINFWLNLTAYFIFLLIVSTGLSLSFVLLPGSRGGRGLALLGMTRHEWGDIHFYLSMAFIAAIVLHVFLHWPWVSATMKRYLNANTSALFAGFGLVSALIVAMPFVAPLQQGVAEPVEHGEIAQDAGQGFSPRGYMTIEEVAASLGMAPEAVLEKIGLPDTVPATAKIGPTCREHGLEMDIARLALTGKSQGEH